MEKIKKLHLKFLLKILMSTRNPKDFDKIWHRLDFAKGKMRHISLLILNDQFPKEEVNHFSHEIIETKKFVIEKIGKQTHPLLVEPRQINDLILPDLEKVEANIKKWAEEH